MTDGALGLTGIALAHGLAIAVMASATAAVSGGHLNPAITLGLFLGRKIGVSTLVGYWIAQCLGAVVAAVLVKTAFPAEVLSAVNMGTPLARPGVTPSIAIMAELIGTFFLVFVVYGTAVDPRAPKCGALFIGLTVAMGIMAVGPISGAALNPARHFGPSIISGNMAGLMEHWVGPLAGGALAGLLSSNTLGRTTT
jgi:aquaporin Z